MPYLGNEVAPLVQALEGKELKIDSDGDSSIQASADDTVVFKTNSNTALKIDANGHITKPLQPAFLAKPSGAQNNMGVNTTVTVAFGTEIFDQNNDFASNTFTAPIGGRYQLSFILRVDQLDKDADYYNFMLITSNRNYAYLFEPDLASGSDITRFPAGISILADMDANDTAYVGMYQAGGSAQTDVIADSYFSGYLAC